MICTGVRWAESTERKNNRAAFELLNRSKEKKMLLSDNDDKRKLFENCQLKAKRVVNPIIDWTDADVWAYIEAERIRMNPLYCEGQHRVGCIGCPMAGKKGREMQFTRWPTYKGAYIRAFEKMIQERENRGLPAMNIGDSAIDVFRWWMEYDVLPGQMDFEEVMGNE